LKLKLDKQNLVVCQRDGTEVYSAQVTSSGAIIFAALTGYGDHKPGNAHYCGSYVINMPVQSSEFCSVHAYMRQVGMRLWHVGKKLSTCEEPLNYPLAQVHDKVASCLKQHPNDVAAARQAFLRDLACTDIREADEKVALDEEMEYGVQCTMRFSSSVFDARNRFAWSRYSREEWPRLPPPAVYGIGGELLTDETAIQTLLAQNPRPHARMHYGMRIHVPSNPTRNPIRLLLTLLDVTVLPATSAGPEGVSKSIQRILDDSDDDSDTEVVKRPRLQ